MIDIRQLRYFVTLAETLHFGRAAERLHISQPPLSRQIAALEKELGVRLLERHSRRTTLTHAARRFLEDARAALDAFDFACRNVRLADKGEVGELSVGFMMHAAHTLVPGLTRRFVDRYPMVRLQLREAVPSVLIDAVSKGRFDAAITFDPGPLRGLQTHRVHEERLCLAVHPSHPLAGRASVGVEHLAGEPLIAAPAEDVPTIYDAIIGYFRAGGLEPSFGLQAQLQQTIVSLVAENLGIALVPSSMSRIGFAGVAFREIEGAPIVAHVIAWRRANSNPALQSFLAVGGLTQR